MFRTWARRRRTGEGGPVVATMGAASEGDCRTSMPIAARAATARSTSAAVKVSFGARATVGTGEGAIVGGADVGGAVVGAGVGSEVGVDAGIDAGAVERVAVGATATDGTLDGPGVAALPPQAATSSAARTASSLRHARRRRGRTAPHPSIAPSAAARPRRRPVLREAGRHGTPGGAVVRTEVGSGERTGRGSCRRGPRGHGSTRTVTVHVAVLPAASLPVYIRE